MFVKQYGMRLIEKQLVKIFIMVQKQSLIHYFHLTIYNISYIFITHDLQAAAYICDRVIIFKDGSIEEIVKIEHLKNVKSFYARKLLQSLITF